MDAPPGRKYKLDTLVDAISMDSTYTTSVLFVKNFVCCYVKQLFHLEKMQTKKCQYLYCWCQTWQRFWDCCEVFLVQLVFTFYLISSTLSGYRAPPLLNLIAEFSAAGYKVQVQVHRRAEMTRVVTLVFPIFWYCPAWILARDSKFNERGLLTRE